MGLAKFLEARIAEDKLAALTARIGSGDREWKAEPPGMSEGRIYDSGGEVVVYDEGSPTFAQAQHIARHDPGRVLREVDAKRQILAEHPMEPGMVPPARVRCCDTNTAQYPQRLHALTRPRPTVRALAPGCSVHKDYDLSRQGITD